MAAFFKVPASAGIVGCAEHVLAPRQATAAAIQLSFRWTRDAEGRLIRAWGEEPRLAIAA